MKKALSVASLAILLAACSGAPPEPPAPPPLDPTGTFGVSINADGMTMNGSLVIEGSADAGYTGYISTDMGGADLLNIAVAGDAVSFEISIPEAQVRFEVTFEGDAFMGSFDGTMGAGSISGQRR